MIKNMNKRKARKQHTCKACDFCIETGEKYMAVTILNEDTCHYETLRYHSNCYDDRNDAEDEFIGDEMRMDDAEDIKMQWDREFQ